MSGWPMTGGSLVPDWLAGYRRKWFTGDLVAGLTVTALLVPEGMAYAQLAGMPPETAFYAAPVALVAYALLGSSRQLVVAVSSTVAIISADTIRELAPEGSDEFIALTAALALVAGVISVVAGLARLGRLAQFFSESVLIGFVFGLALLISVKQVPKVLGIESGDGDFFERVWDILRHLGDAHGPTVVVGVTTIVLMLALEQWYERVPAALVALVGGIVVGEVFDLAANGVEVIGELPSGLVGPAIPDVAAADLTLLVAGGFGIAVVSFAEAMGPARSFASEHRYNIDVDKELVGLGAANVAAGAFQGFPIGSSLSKSAANDRAGAKTPMSLIVAAAMTALVALFLTGIFENLPEPTLGAIVIVAVSGMMKVPEMKRLWRVRRIDFGLAVVALFAVLLFDALLGLVIAVLVSVAAVVWRAATPTLAVMGRVPGQAGYVNVARVPDAESVDGLIAVRPDVNLFFANGMAMRDRVNALVAESDPPPETVLLDLEATTDADVPSCDALIELAADLRDDGVVLALARVHRPVFDLFERAGVVDAVGRENFSARVIDAVAAHLARTGREPAEGAISGIAAASLRTVYERLPGDSSEAARIREAIEALEADNDDRGSEQ